MTELTTGLCQCGCGEPAPVAQRNENGYLKGQPKRFIRGHSTRSAGAPWWRGDDASYGAIHTYLRSHFPKTGACDECGITGKRTEYALIHGREYSRNREDYRELCKQCHNAYDGIGGSRWKGVVTARQAAPERPLCACGCGTPVNWDYKHARWRRFVGGHYSGTARREVQGLAPITGDAPPKRRRERPERRVVRVPVNCAHCGTEFAPTRRDTQFCSKKCKAAARRAAGVDDVTQTCHVCTGAYESNKYDRVRHCSQSCAAVCQHAGACPDLGEKVAL